MNKINELNACVREQEEEQSIVHNNFKCNICNKSYSNEKDFNKHLISVQHNESINYKIGLMELNTKLFELIEKDEHEKIMNRLNQELLEINKRTDKLREERKERVRIEKEIINAFLSLFCLKIV